MEPRKYKLASNYKSHICSKFKQKFYPINPMLMWSLPLFKEIPKNEGTKNNSKLQSKEFRKYNGGKRHQWIMFLVRFIL
jgi:hypothetical protein